MQANYTRIHKSPFLSSPEMQLIKRGLDVSLTKDLSARDVAMTQNPAAPRQRAIDASALEQVMNNGGVVLCSRDRCIDRAEVAGSHHHQTALCCVCGGGPGGKCVAGSRLIQSTDDEAV